LEPYHIDTAPVPALGKNFVPAAAASDPALNLLQYISSQLFQTKQKLTLGVDKVFVLISAELNQHKTE
jgi:hypothetical protein